MRVVFDSHNSRERVLMNFILLCLYIIIILAWFIDTLHILLQLERNVKVKETKTSRETNENMHSNSARAKFVN